MSAPDRNTGHRRADTPPARPGDGAIDARDGGVAGERERLAAELHRGLVQHVTALSLAVDHALLASADGDASALDASLRSLRAIADVAVRDCRALIDGLRRGHP